MTRQSTNGRRRARTGTTPGSNEQRFPGYDVEGQAPSWDETTRAVVLGRLRPGGPLRFFSTRQEPTVRALLDRLLAQDDEPRVPVAEMVDQRLLERRGDGYRYADMPEDWEAWPASVDALEAEARARAGRSFADLGRHEQLALLDEVRRDKGSWHGLPAGRIFQLWLRYACDAYYSHPWAWNEIGFGGPAYPRGYKNLGIGRREPFEVPEHDASDPIPWAQRVERAQADHLGAPGSPADAGHPQAEPNGEGPGANGRAPARSRTHA